MTFGARFGSFALIVGFVVGVAPVLAQTEAPSGTSDKAAQTETSSTWTDPPVRGAIGPKAADSAKPADNASVREKARPATDKPAERAAAPEQGAPSETGKQQSAVNNRPAHRTAKLGRERIRLAVRSHRAAGVHALRPRYGRVARLHEDDPSRHHARGHDGEHRAYAYRAYRSEPPRYGGRFVIRDRDAFEQDFAPPPYAARRAGWGALTDDSRERRIARARAAGYLVMRSRTYLYSDGMRVREMMPYESYGYD